MLQPSPGLLHAAVAQSLPSVQVEIRRQTYGTNELPPSEPTPFWQLVLKQFEDLMVPLPHLASHLLPYGTLALSRSVTPRAPLRSQ